MAEAPWLRFYPPNLQHSLEYPKIPIAELLRSSAKKHPDNTALIFLDSRISYKQLDSMVDAFAVSLHELGVKEGSRVGIFLPNFPHFVVSYFAALRLGATVVPCNPLYKEKELEYQLNDAGTEVLIASNDKIGDNELFSTIVKIRDRVNVKHIIICSLTDFLSSIKKALAPLKKIRKIAYPNTINFMGMIDGGKPPHVEIDPINDVAVLQYTGGTTGMSKGTMLSHYNLVSNAIMVSKWLPMREANEINLAVIPFFHIYGLTVSLNAPILSATTIILHAKFDVKHVLETLEKEKVTVFCGVPPMYMACINHPEVSRYRFNTLRGCISGAAALPLSVRKKFNELTSANLVEGYGLTEASPVTHCNPLHKNATVKEGSIGIPLPDTYAKIVDAGNMKKELSPNETGELCIKGPQVMLGYWNKPDETAMVLKDGWLLTGDIAKMDIDGYFYIVDRKKDMINVSGFKVWPREVEEVLYQHQAVKEAAVIGAPDEYRGESVKAYVVLKDGFDDKISEGEITKFCKEKLASFKTPKTIEFRKELPKSIIGKVLRRHLREETAKHSLK
ncbi:MAG: long-chain fatty acid--CoA ligase [Thaumarchaeota archaeon]|nr:long-chain fatty acid--CoA ligase [Nitrososphaerota archaeon]